MKNKSIIKNSIIYIIPIVVIFFNILIILFPSDIITSAKNGLLLWFNNVIPSLLPFIIGANILSMTGFINLIGVASEPITRKLFKISGYGAFALIMGFISGYPIGAKITASLYENNKITKSEAQKLIMFTNNSGPLFILGTVAVSMLNLPKAGTLIILSHYLSALTIGIALRNYNSSEISLKRKTPNLKYTISQIKNDYIKNNMSIGIILKQSVKDSMESILMIGGFIILFSVLSKMMEITEVSIFLTKLMTPLFNTLNINTDFIFPIATGMLEITNGCKNIASLPHNITTIAITAGIISWGGFSIHAQSMGFLSKLKIKAGLYILSKFIQGILSVIYVYILNIFLNVNFSETISTFKIETQSPLNILTESSINFLLITLLIFMLSIIIYIYNLLRKH